MAPLARPPVEEASQRRARPPEPSLRERRPLELAIQRDPRRFDGIAPHLLAVDQKVESLEDLRYLGQRPINGLPVIPQRAKIVHVRVVPQMVQAVAQGERRWAAPAPRRRRGAGRRHLATGPPRSDGRKTGST